MGGNELLLTLIVWMVVPVIATAAAGSLFGLHKLSRKKQIIVVVSAFWSVALSFALGQVYILLATVPLLVLPLLAARFGAKLSLARSSAFAFTYIVITLILQLLVVIAGGASFF